MDTGPLLYTIATVLVFDIQIKFLPTKCPTFPV